MFKKHIDVNNLSSRGCFILLVKQALFSGDGKRFFSELS